MSWKDHHFNYRKKELFFGSINRAAVLCAIQDFRLFKKVVDSQTYRYDEKPFWRFKVKNVFVPYFVKTMGVQGSLNVFGLPAVQKTQKISIK
jgi:hypothetical protein